MILVLLPQRFMESKKSLFVLVPPILSIKNSMASTEPSGLRTLRRIHILFSRSRSTSSSSLRVPEAAISIAGKIRLSARRRSRWTSMFPVPLNSSKITSSMRLPVSTMAVAMIVRLPPSSMFRAAPKNRLGRCSALESKPPERTLPLGERLKHHGLAGPGSRHDQPALALADRGDEFHDAGAVLVRIVLQIDPLLRIERGQVVEQDLVAGDFGVLVIDLLDLEQGEVPFALLGRADLAGHDIAGSQVEASDLGWGDVDVVRSGEVVGVGSPKKSEAVRERTTSTSPH